MSSTPFPHQYFTRSSPPQGSSVVPHTQHAGNLQLRAEIFVKDTVGSRDHSEKRLQPQIFEGNSWDGIRSNIFNHCSSHLKSKASYTDEPRIWTISDETRTLNDFDTFISSKLARHHSRPTSSEQANCYLADHASKTFTIIVLKWGNQVNTSNDLQELQDQCILPEARDRAGAAAENLQQDIVTQLKEQWSSHLSGYDSAWRIWAATILKRPRHMHPRLVQEQPPSGMLHYFRSVPNSAEHRCERLQRSLTLAREVVETSIRDFSTIEKDMEILMARVRSYVQTLTTKQEMIDSFLTEVVVPNNEDVIAATLQNIPNIDDTEHEEDD
ncbi:hypothetical protein Ae201684P_014674 [Aphanomyces euteiches]|nr:hypothetical protein Ae201684P_014674 [Aphanomyces euteiches]